jgi:hypothetical protein
MNFERNPVVRCCSLSCCWAEDGGGKNGEGAYRSYQIYDRMFSTQHQVEKQKQYYVVAYYVADADAEPKKGLRTNPGYVYVSFAHIVGLDRTVVSTLHCGCRNLGSIPSLDIFISFFVKVPALPSAMPRDVFYQLVPCGRQLLLRLSYLYKSRRIDQSSLLYVAFLFPFGLFYSGEL